MFRNKCSFSLITLAIYVFAAGILIEVMIGSGTIIDNAKVIRLMNEIDYYNKANLSFVTKYSSLPGLLNEGKCVSFDEFKPYCRNQDNINLTTSEKVYASLNCNATLGCTLEANGKAGSEDILRNFLLPMRYLKTAGEIDTIHTGIDVQLSQDEDYSKKTWAPSRIEKNIYINIYNYYNNGNATHFLFNNHFIFGHNRNSLNQYDQQEKLLHNNNQYLIYQRLDETPKGSVPVNVASKLDIKIDDGRPLTGKLTTFATTDYSTDFQNSNYAKCIDAMPQEYSEITSINYQQNKKQMGYCDIIYEMTNVSNMVNGDTDGADLRVHTLYQGANKCDLLPNGNIGECKAPTGGYYSGLKRCLQYEDGTERCVSGSKTGLIGQNSADMAYYTITYVDGTTRKITLHVTNENKLTNPVTGSYAWLDCNYCYTGRHTVGNKPYCYNNSGCRRRGYVSTITCCSLGNAAGLAQA